MSLMCHCVCQDETSTVVWWLTGQSDSYTDCPVISESEEVCLDRPVFSVSLMRVMLLYQLFMCHTDVTHSDKLERV